MSSVCVRINQVCLVFSFERDSKDSSDFESRLLL
jgi:hypothetical protein